MLLRLRADPDAACRDFRWPALDRFNWALDYFDVMAKGNERIALHVAGPEGETKLSFAEISAGSSRLASFLRRRGVARGDRILLMLGNIVPLWEVMLAAMKLGAVVIPATTLLGEADLKDRVARGRVRHVVAEPEVADRLSFLPAEVTRFAAGEVPGWISLDEANPSTDEFRPEGDTRASDPLLLYFTSGTTSKPKLVLHTHESYPVGHLSTMYWIGVGSGDVHLNISAPGWAKHAWSSFFAPWNAGATILVHNQPRFTAPRLLTLMTSAGVTSFCAPPTVWRLLIQEKLADWRVALREAVAAGEPLNPEVIRAVAQAWGVTIRDGYGQTETTLQIGNPPGARVRPGSMGRPMPGYRVALLDAAGNEAEEGEIAIDLASRPLGLMAGYQQEDGHMAPVAGDWYRTGDVARRDADGALFYVGRIDDVFKASDYRISPFELESVLIEHPSIVEAAVVPSPDAARLAVPKAFIVLADGVAPDRMAALAVFRHIRASLSPFRRIRRIEFGALPKTISGKIRRVELRASEAARDLAAPPEGEYREEDFPELGR